MAEPRFELQEFISDFSDDFPFLIILIVQDPDLSSWEWKFQWNQISNQLLKETGLKVNRDYLIKNIAMSSMNSGCLQIRLITESKNVAIQLRMRYD